jgi:hypothetical protein
MNNVNNTRHYQAIAIDNALAMVVGLVETCGDMTDEFRQALADYSLTAGGSIYSKMASLYEVVLTCQWHLHGTDRKILWSLWSATRRYYDYIGRSSLYGRIAAATR